MNKKKLLIGIAAATPIATVPFVATTLTSCTTIHIHTFTSDWEYDETKHWKTCDVCHEHFEEGNHVYNELNDKCLICGYQDPLVVQGMVDGKESVIGLTPHGKEKLVFNCPETVHHIAEGAFLGANCKTVRINKECETYYKSSFEDDVFITYEDPSVPWIEHEDGLVEKDPTVADAEARIGDKYYDSLKAAIEDVGIGNTTITILKEYIDFREGEKGGDINVNHPVSLVALNGKANIRGNFNISGGGILYIPETITYQGNVKLMLGEMEEVRANTDSLSEDNTYETVYNSGSIVFTHRSTKPTGVKVSYVTSFSGGAELPAVGSHQVVNDLLVLPVDNYAWGTFRFSEDFRTIKGLTEYGKTVNGLTITQVVENIPATIGKYAFNTISCITIRAKGHEIFHLYFHWLKGMFFHLTIGKGITEVGHSAFNCNYDADIGREMVAAIAPIFSHIFDLTIGNDLVKINGLAFHDSVSLERIVVSDAVESNNDEAQLDVIGGDSFRNAINLVSADLSQAIHLDVIDECAFNNCRNLSQAILPPLSWTVKDDDASGPGLYFPYDFSPERAAYLLSHESARWESIGSLAKDRVWYSNNLPYINHPSKNKNGWFNYVLNSQRTPNAVFQDLDDGNEIYIASTPKGDEDVIKIEGNLLEKSVSIVASDEANVRIVGTTDGVPNNDPISINPGCYLALSNVRLNSDIVLKTNHLGDNQYNNPSGFAINPSFIKKSDIINVTFNNGTDMPVQAAPNMINLRGRVYDGYGLCDFKVEEDIENPGKQITTLFHMPRGEDIDMGLARSSQTITLGHQTYVNEGSKVIIDGTAMGNDSRKGWMTRVNISDDVEKIYNGFFSNHGTGIDPKGFEKLIEVSGGKKLKYIGVSEFRNSPLLQSVSLEEPENLAEGERYEIYGAAFRDCTNLLSVSLPKGLTKIGDNCFQDCKILQSIEFPSTLETIGELAFQGCKTMMFATLPDENVLSTIGYRAFKDCKNLLTFHFGNNVEGWKVKEPSATDWEDVTDDLSDDEIAATCLVTTYVEKEWTKA